MRGLDALISACTGRRWGTIVWAGPGYGSGIEAVRALDARRWVYLEPNTDLRARLARKYVFSERETLSGTALWSKTDVLPFHVVSDPLQSSLLPRDELLKAWPNLREIDRYEVTTQSLDEFALEHEVSPEEDNLLILELCGAELEVLSSADEALMARFTLIAIQQKRGARGEEPGWLRLLLSRGYELHDPIEESKGGWILLRGERLDVDAVPAAAHAELVAKTERELQQSSERETQLEARLQESAQRAAQFSAELAQAVQRATQLETELQQSMEHAAQLEIGLHESAQHAIHLDSELQKSVQHVAQMDAELQQSVQRTAQLDADLQQTRQTMRMAVQMQAQREADLTDLQARYRDGQDALQRQHVLLDKLGERLGLASDYFHQLSTSTDESQPRLAGAGSQVSSGEGNAETAPRGSGRASKTAKPKSRG